jgi:hypothetical protein
MGLIISGRLWVILVLPAAWILSMFFPNFFMFIFPLITGWVNGGLVYEYFSSASGFWYYASCALGTLFMFLLCTVVIAIVCSEQ